VKSACNIFYFIYGPRVFEDNLLLLLTVLFSAAELLLSIFIFVNIFRGLESFFQISGRMDHAKKSDGVLLMLKIFIIIKPVLAIIVRAPVLISEVVWDNWSVYFGVYLDGAFMKNLLTAPCFIIQTLLGIFFLSFYMPFFSDIAKDKELSEFVKSKINTALINDNFFAVKQNLNSAFLLFAAGCVFFVDFRLDNINILPDPVICLLFLSGIILITKTNPEAKNKKLEFYLAANFLISVCAYILALAYKLVYLNSFIGENEALLHILKLTADISYQLSVIMFFVIFIEFYVFIKNLQRAHLEFSVRYFNKYITRAEKDFDAIRTKNKAVILSACAFCVKTLSAILPESGDLIFAHSVILIAFVFLAIKWIYSIRGAVYSYYN